MSRSKLFNMIKSRGEQPNGRNDFDLSNWHGYTQNFATIQPLKAVHTITDDYMEVTLSDIAQNISPMNTAAPLSAQRELCAYFIPYNFIWHNYNQYQATREDPDSSAMQVKGIAYEPRFATYDLYFQAAFFFSEYYNTLVCRRAYNHGVNLFGDTPLGDDHENMEFLSSKFAKQIYDYYETTRTYTLDYLFTASEVESMRLFNSQNQFKGHYYGIEDGNGLNSGKVSNSAVFMDVVGQWKWCDVIRKFDMFGYGNIYPLFAYTLNKALGSYDDFISELDSHKSDENYDFDDFLSDYADYLVLIKAYFTNLVTRLKMITVRLDSKGDYLSIAWNTQVELSKCKRLSVYPLFSYNHIFYNMFRNTYRDLDYNVRNYNCDFLSCTSDAGSTIELADLPVRFLNLECHQWKKDMFTSLLPDMQIGAVQGISLNVSSDVVVAGSEVAGNYAISTSSYKLKRSSELTDGSLPTTWQQGNISLIGSSTGSTSFDVLALKRAEALQQYYMDLMRAGNRTEDIFKQVYGKAPKSEEHKTPYFVEASTSPLSVNPILATADTGSGENGSLGDIAARAIVQSKPLSFKFSTSDFGCLIFLSFMSVDSAYNSYRIDPHLMNLTPESHFIPQLMNLGYEWLTRESLNNLKLGIEQDQPLGCSPRYIEFKTDVDLVHGNLVDAVDLINDDFPAYEGSLDIWAVTRTDMQQENEVSLRNFYQDPRVVNNIFKIQKSAFDPSYETDQFICFTYLKINSVRQLSELGLPRFV